MPNVKCRDEYVAKRVMRLVERTADRDGQLLLEPEYELEGWWTSLEEAPEAMIKRYQAHATHEQFHSEIKRRRLRTVLQELVHRVALGTHKARQIILDVGQDIGRMTVLNTLRARLRYPRRSPC